MKAMSFFAKLLLILTVALMGITVKYIAVTEVVRSDVVRLDVYNGRVVFYTTFPDATYNKHECINLTVGDVCYSNVEILDKILLDSYIGNEQIVMYCIDLSDTTPGESAKISIVYRSLIDYISKNRTLIE